MSVTPTLIQGYDMEYLVSKEDLEVYYDPRLDVLWVDYDEHLKEIEYLQGQLSATESLLDKAMTLVPDPEALEYLITLARNAPNLAKNEVALIEHFEQLWEKL